MARVARSNMYGTTLTSVMFFGVLLLRPRYFLQRYVQHTHVSAHSFVIGSFSAHFFVIGSFSARPRDPSVHL